MPSPTVVIAGAGIAGLCAGVYARRAGFDVEIVEKETAPGGLATSWQRQGYTFENCLHWLLGSNARSPWRALWKEVCDFDRLTFVEADEFLRLESESGPAVTFWRDVERLEAELLRAAPEDAAIILRVMRGVRRLSRFDLPLAAEGRVANARAYLRMLPLLPEMRHWSRISSAQLGAEFTNPLLRRFFDGGGEQSAMAAITLLFALAWMTKKDAGYPIGGSHALIRGIEERFRALGGRIRYQTKVDRVLIDDDRAVGFLFTNGDHVRAEWVISAADGHATLFDWIPDRYRDVRAEEPYRSVPPFPSYLLVSLGVRRDLSSQPAFFVRLLSEPVPVDPRTLAKSLSFRVFHFDPTFAPAGKTAVTCFIPTTDAEYWTSLQRDDASAYATRKQQIAEAVIRCLERRIPGVRADIEVIDVATPASVIRHTGNWKGSMEGFIVLPKAGFRPLRMSLPRLDHFRMVGQWVMPGGGLPSGLITARRCIQDICRLEGRSFELREQGKPLRPMHPALH
jgi:phytoene dehydrogenase-like protein